MDLLKNKIPPPLVALFFGFALWLVHSRVPSASFGGKYHYYLAAIFFLIGVYFVVSGVRALHAQKTTVNPVNPEKATALVTFGIYQVTRNPMYVGLAFILLAWAAFLGTWLGLIAVLGFVIYMNQFQIKPEEEALTQLFGEEYLEYKSRVRRWL